MDTITLLATVPAILALTNLAKSFGVTGRWSALLAVALGVALNVADGAFAGQPLYEWAATGLILGLGAAGLHDVAKTVSPAPASVIYAEPDGSDPGDQIEESELTYDPERAI